MSLFAKSKSFQGPADGTYIAVLRGVWDVGIQAGYEGGEPVQKVVAAFELEVRRADGLRHEVSEAYTLSTNEKSKLRPLIEALLGRTLSNEEITTGVDIETLIGRCALVQAKSQERNGGKYPRIAGAIPLPSATKPIVAERDRFTMPELAKSMWAKRILNTNTADSDVPPSQSATTPASSPKTPSAPPVTDAKEVEKVSLF